MFLDKMRSYVIKPLECKKNWIIVDATDCVVGRLAAFIASRLIGKHRADYTPHVDCGDRVVVVNAEKVVFSGQKLTDKVYYRHTGFPGGIKETTPKKILASKFPQRILEKAVERMISRGPLGRKRMKNLYIYAGSSNPHEAQNPEVVNFAELKPKNSRRKLWN